MAKEWIVPDADLGCDGAYFDYQELVRCGECKYWSEPVDEVDGKLYGQCERPITAINHHSLVSSKWFCADGEREVQE